MLLGAFAMAVRQGRFFGECFKVLAERIVQGTISHVVQAFWAKGRQNPTTDVNQKLSILLARQFCAFRSKDPEQVQQKALTFAALDELAKRQVTDLDKAILQLTINTALFACCSCKYPKVPCRDMKCTKLLCLQMFSNDRHLLSMPSDSLELANSQAVTFEMQKNDHKHDTVIHGWTDVATLCPVLQLAWLINWIEHILVQNRTLQYVQFDAMANWSKNHHNK
jgi:hypothetical protein